MLQILKVDENKFYAILYEEFKFRNQIKLLKHSKYLYIWSGRFQILTINLRTSLFQVEGSDVEHGLIFNICNYLILVFLCNFCYFRFRLFVSFFLGTFNVVQSNQGFIYFRSCLMVSSCPRFCFYYLNALQLPNSLVFRIIKFQWILTIQFLFIKESIVCIFFRLL